MCSDIFPWGIHIWNFKTLACTVLEERTDGRTHNPKPICPVNFFKVGGIKRTYHGYCMKEFPSICITMRVRLRGKKQNLEEITIFYALKWKIWHVKKPYIFSSPEMKAHSWTYSKGRHQSSFHQHFQRTSPLKPWSKFLPNFTYSRRTNNCVFSSNWMSTLVAMATYICHWLIMGKVEIGIYCCLTADILTKV